MEGVRFDTGFIVHNDRTYPTLCRLFAELGVHTRESDMSMLVRCVESGLEYADARGPRGLFAQPRNFARPAYLKMLREVPRFHRAARMAGRPGWEEYAARTSGFVPRPPRRLG